MDDGPHGLTRREFVERVGMVGAAVGLSGSLGSLLAACGSERSTSAASPSGKGSVSPRRGGVLKIGFVGAGVKESMDPHEGPTSLENARMKNLYEPLVVWSRDMKMEHVLAESLEPNADCTEWQIKLRKGVTFHNGKTLTADDVIYSWNRMVKDETEDHAGLNPIDLAAVKKVDDYTLLVPLKYPYALLPLSFMMPTATIIPEGLTDWSAPNGTGPYKFESWIPGEKTTLVRNGNYWQSDRPYIDEIHLLSISDESARVNAIVSGQVDAISSFPVSQAKAVIAAGTDLGQSALIETTSGFRLMNAAGASIVCFAMDTTAKPFTDVRVRQALRLAIDRKLVVQNAFSGFAAIGNDMYGSGYEGYPDLPQREYDPEQAKSILKQAGLEGVSIEATTSEAETPYVPMTAILQQSAKAAGITVRIKKVPPGDYYTSFWMQEPFFTTWWTNKPFVQLYGQVFASNANSNECRLKRPELDAQFDKAIGTLDAQERAEALNRIQEWHWNNGGYIIPAIGNYVDAIGSRVQGAVAAGPEGLDNGRFKDWYLTA